MSRETAHSPVQIFEADTVPRLRSRTTVGLGKHIRASGRLRLKLMATRDTDTILAPSKVTASKGMRLILRGRIMVLLTTSVATALLRPDKATPDHTGASDSLHKYSAAATTVLQWNIVGTP